MPYIRHAVLAYIVWIPLVLFICNQYNFLGEREIALQDQDISFDTDNDRSDPPEPSDPNLGFTTINQKRFKCLVCEDSECSAVCTDAITVKILILFYPTCLDLNSFSYRRWLFVLLCSKVLEIQDKRS